MDYFIQIVSNLGQDPAAMRWLMIAMIASAIFVAGFGVILLVSGAFNPVRKRLYDAAGYRAPTRAS